jgi:hypothetical protein
MTLSESTGKSRAFERPGELLTPTPFSCGIFVLVLFDDGDEVASSGKQVCVEFSVWFRFLAGYRSALRMILRCENAEV